MDAAQIQRAPLVSATVVYGTAREDIAVPDGTPVATVLGKLGIDLDAPGTKITRTDGEPVELTSLLGPQLAAGVVLNVTSQQTGQKREKSRSVRVRSFGNEMITHLPSMLFAVLVEFCAVVLPLVFPTGPVEWWMRLVPCLIALAVVVTVARRRFLSSSLGALGMPLLFGCPLMVLIDPIQPAAAHVALAVGTAGAAAAAFVIWYFVRESVSVTSAALWGMVALLVELSLFTAAGTAQIAPVILLTGVVVTIAANWFALPVPESQLVDLPLLTTSAPAVRQPEARPPARITPTRVRLTVNTAAVVTETCILGGAVLVVASSGFVGSLIDFESVNGRAALVLVVSSLLLLSLTGRTFQLALLRRVPRVAAAIAAAIVSAVLVAMGTLPSAGMIGYVILLGVVLIWGTALVTNEPHSAFLGRTADVLQGFSAVTLLPATVLVSGLFDLVRQVSS